MMRRFLFFLLFAFSFSVSTSAQSGMLRTAARYFRVNPLDRDFSLFIKQLLSDTAFFIDEQHQRTDTSLFYVRGHYKHFNPFIYASSVVQLVLTESIIQDDSTGVSLDTIMVYQVSAVTRTGKDKLEEVKTQYQFFRKKYGKDYFHAIQEPLQDAAGKPAGEVSQYYASLPLYIPAVSAYYSKLADAEKYVFSILLRFKIRDNRSVLPIPPDAF